MAKQRITIFVSYSSKEAKLADQLLEELRQHFAASRKYEVRFWLDRKNIELGEKWHDTILKALKECDFGLLLMSSAFLGSEYIKQNELPELINRNRVLPVALKPWPTDADLRGLEKHQVFRHNHQAFHQSRNKSAFGLACYERIVQRLATERAKA